MYKPGTLVTLKDGDVYRTSKAEFDNKCDDCVLVYLLNGKHLPCSTFNKPNAFLAPNILPTTKRAINACYKMYGDHYYPKLVTLCTNQDN